MTSFNLQTLAYISGLTLVSQLSVAQPSSASSAQTTKQPAAQVQPQLNKATRDMQLIQELEKKDRLANKSDARANKIKKSLEKKIIATKKQSMKSDTKQNAKILRLEQRLATLERRQQANRRKPSRSKAAPAKRSSQFLPNFVSARENFGSVPSYNQDLALLTLRQKNDRQLYKNAPYPRVELGGSVIMTASSRVPPLQPLQRVVTQENDINLTGANVNLGAEMTDLLIGNMRISYNPSGVEKTDETTITTRVSNSSIFLNTARLTLGDLNRFPFYVAAGQIFLPFGAYNSSLLIAPLTARVGRMRQRPVLLGFQEPGTDKGFNASLFTFRGDSFSNNRSRVINNGGVNLGYVMESSWFSLDTGASYISNIADAGGMLNTGASSVVTDAGEWLDNEFIIPDDEFNGPLLAFRGFGANGKLVHTVSAYDARATFELTKFHVGTYAEIVMPTRAFDETNLSFSNGDYDGGARPSAWNAEVFYKFNLFNKKNTVAVGYSRSYQALGLNMPQYNISAAYAIRFHELVNLSLGYTFESAYPLGTFATGQDLPVAAARLIGTSNKSISAQVNARF